MKKALLLDTSIGTSNVGDDIIMECVEKELAPILANMFVFRLPTHVPAFHSYAIRMITSALWTVQLGN